MERCRYKQKNNKVTIFKKIIGYVIATIVTLWMGESILFHNQIPKFYWFAIALAFIMWTACFGVAEGLFKKDSDWSFRKHPVSVIGMIATVISGIMAIIQIVLFILS